jgi:riboflavin synthase
MFTGLIEDTGTIASITTRGSGREIGVRTGLPLGEVRIGDSIAVDGACLTAERIEGDRFFATCGRETLEKTTLGQARVGRRVHLERALRLGDRLGGHMVQGHVDGTARVRSVTPSGESVVIWVDGAPELLRYVASKGSVCVNGVSLTVNEVDARGFRVNIVPHTATRTHLGALRSGESVNIEVDVLAKYVERLVKGAP